MSEVQNLIIETATRLFEDYCTPETIRQAEKGEWPADLWAKVEETGLTLASLPESIGGAGGNLSDALAVLRVAGQFNVPLPLAETYLSKWVLAESELPLSDGPLTVAYSPELRFTRQGDQWTVGGTAKQVGWARHASQILVMGQSKDGLQLGLVSPDQAKLIPGQNLAGEPRDTVLFEATEVKKCYPQKVSQEWLKGRAALARTALTVGALEALFKRTITYAGERVQFGRALNQFQAIQQQLAIMAGEVTSARIGLEAATTEVEEDQGDKVLAAVAAAKIRAGEAAGQVAAIAHQVHAAMGYTYEYPLHFSSKRLWAWREEDGSESEWARWLGGYIARQGADNLWPSLIS